MILEVPIDSLIVLIIIIIWAMLTAFLIPVLLFPLKPHWFVSKKLAEKVIAKLKRKFEL